jgi:hypothetical protein
MVKVRLVFAALLLLAAGQVWSEIKVETLVWADYSHLYTSTNFSVNTNTNMSFIESGGQFSIGRVYFTLQGDIGKDPFGGSLKGRLTLDMTKPATPVKYAYVDYKLMGWDPLVLTLGLLKTQFGNLGNWEYPLPLKDATEQYSAVKPTASADWGFAISGNALPIEGMTKNLLTYYVQIVDGSGYETTPTDISQFAILASAYISPIDGTRIGFSYRTEPSVSPNNAALMTNASKNSWAVMASAQDFKIGDMVIPVDFLFQYIYSENVINTNIFGGASSLATNLNGNVLTVSLGFGLFENLFKPYVRYDMVNENTAQTNIYSKAYNYSYLMFGLDYIPTKNMVFKPFYSMNLTTGSFQVMLQGEFKVNFTVWQ